VDDGYQNSRKRYAPGAGWIDVSRLQFFCFLRLARIDSGKGIKRQYGTAFLIIFGNDDTDCQGQKMDSKEKKQNSVLGVPTQKQKNEGAKKQ
jgi:hypothetical protein